MPMEIEGQYNSTLPTLSNRDYAPIQVDINGRPIVVSGGSGTTADQVQGNVASGAADSGNPVKVGGVYKSSPATLTDGQRGDAQLDNRGNTKVTLYGTDSLASTNVSSAAADGVVATNGGLFTNTRNYTFNGATYDRLRGNVELSLLTSAARTTTQTVSDQTNYNGRGLHLILSVTSAGTGSITVDIQGKDSVSGAYYSILTGIAVTTNSTTVYKIYPGLTGSANAAANDTLPRTWRVVVTANNANSVTYSVGATIIL